MFCRLKLPLYICFIINTKTNIMRTLVFFIALCITCYSFIKMTADLANFIKDKSNKGYDMTFFLLACVFWSIFYHLNN